MKKLCPVLLCFFILLNGFCQSKKDDSVRLDYRKIYSLCLDGNVKPALVYISAIDSNKLTRKDRLFKYNFENRFGYKTDRETREKENHLPISGIVKLYRNYWRISLLDSAVNQDSVLILQLGSLLLKKYPGLKDSVKNTDSLDLYLRKDLASAGYFTTGFSKTGRLFDLLVWKKQQDTTYFFVSGKDSITALVVFMDDFVTLGWEEYATLEKFYPGGWAGDTALFCVKKAYDLKSELFLISYLAHEGRHMRDYKLFRKLTSADLEYRGKMTELSLADSTLYHLIGFFIVNGNYNSENGHSIANYCAIRDLSLAIFHKDYESDLAAWKKIPVSEIHEAAKKILAANTKSLLALGSKAGDRIFIKQ